MKITHILIFTISAFAGLMPSPTKADFTEGLVIGYFSGVISDSIKDSVHRPMNVFCSAADTLQRFPPPQDQCSVEEYSILLIEQTSILYNFIAFCISGFCIMSCVKTCATGTPDERATLMGAFVGISLQDWLTSD